MGNVKQISRIARNDGAGVLSARDSFFVGCIVETFGRAFLHISIVAYMGNRFRTVHAVDCGRNNAAGVASPFAAGKQVFYSNV